MAIKKLLFVDVSIMQPTLAIQTALFVAVG